MTKFGTQPETLKMQSMQNNGSMSDIPKSPHRIDITKEDNGWTSVRVSRPTSAQGTPPTFPPTSPEYCPMRSPTPSKCSGTGMSWTACTEDACQIHRTDKESTYFPQPQQPNKSPAGPSEWEQTCEIQPPTTGPSGFNQEPPTGRKATSEVHQKKKDQHGRIHWTKCYRDGCWQYKEEKTKNRYYPRRPIPGEKKERGWGKDARTHPWGEGSERPSRISKPTKGISKNCWKKGTETGKRLLTSKQMSETREGRS